MITAFLPTLATVLFAAAQDGDVVPRALPREPRTIHADGVSYEADVGRIVVLAERARPDGARIELAVARLKGRGAPDAAPVVFLAGGPGAGATHMVDHPMWMAYLDLGDVLLIDQRGTGRTQPSLSVVPPGFDPALLFGERPAALEAVLDACKTAREALAAKGIDPADYTTGASADDVADVLAVLGYKQARILAHSYGTHWALELLRLHPEVVERCVLLGVAGPDDLLKPAGELEPFVAELARNAKADPECARVLPDLEKTLDMVLERLQREPLQVSVRDPETGSESELGVGAFGLQRMLLMDLGDPSDLPVMPRLIAELERGETDTLSWFATKRLAQARELPVAFYALRGSSGVSRERRKRIQEDARTSRFEDARNFPFPEVVEALGIRDAGDEFRKPVKSTVPCLLLSGTLDANTPAHQAEAVRRALTKCVHLVVENAGHDDLLFDARIRERAVAFLAGDAPTDEPLALDPYRIAPMEGFSDVHPALSSR